MSAGKFWAAITDEHGEAGMIIDPPQITPAQRRKLEALTGAALDELTAAPGIVSREHAAEVLLAAVVRQHADQMAYERVAAARGVLPL